MSILVSGGADYIGSHTCAELLQAGYEIIVVDSMSYSLLSLMDRKNKQKLLLAAAILRDRNYNEANG